MENDVRTEGMYEYTVRFGEATIVRHLIEYGSGEHDIVIPAYLGGYPVVEIGGAAFQDQFNITGSVTIPEGVRVIGWGAFFDCHEIAEIKLPRTLERIEDRAFAYCCGLRWMVVPRGVNYIGEHAFWRCSSATKIWLPDTVTDIEDWTFDECGQLYELYMHSGTKISGERVFDRCWELNEVIRYEYMEEPMDGGFERAEGVGLVRENIERYKMW